MVAIVDVQNRAGTTTTTTTATTISTSLRKLFVDKDQRDVDGNNGHQEEEGEKEGEEEGSNANGVIRHPDSNPNPNPNSNPIRGADCNGGRGGGGEGGGQQRPRSVSRTRNREVSSRYMSGNGSSATAAATAAVSTAPVVQQQKRPASPSVRKGRSPSPSVVRPAAGRSVSPGLRRRAATPERGGGGGGGRGAVASSAQQKNSTPTPNPTPNPVAADRRPISAGRRRPWPTSSVSSDPAVKDPVQLASAKVLTRRGSGHALDSGRALDSGGGSSGGGLWPSKSSLPNSNGNSLSMSMQSESSDGGSDRQNHALRPTGNSIIMHRKTNSAPVTGAGLQGKPERKGTPERRTSTSSGSGGGNMSENQPQQRWPSMTSGIGSRLPAQMSRSMDLTSSFSSTASSSMARSNPSSRYPTGGSAAAAATPLKAAAPKGGSSSTAAAMARSFASLSRSINEGPPANHNTGRRLSVSDIAPPQLIRPRASVDDSEPSPRPSLPYSCPDDHSDTDSISSASSSAAAQSVVKAPIRGTAVPARFFQDMVSRLRGDNKSLPASESGSRRSSRSSSGTTPSNPMWPSFGGNGGNGSMASTSGTSTPQTPSSPHTKPSSPSHRGGGVWAMGSPTRSSSSSSSNSSRSMQQPTMPPLSLSLNSSRPTSFMAMMTSSSSSLGSFGLLDSRKGGRIKASPTQSEDGHEFRILHNRWLQWHFVNACAEESMDAQKCFAQSVLYNAGQQISDLQSTVAAKRVQLQKARHNLMVERVISSQEPPLETWQSLLRREHTSALTGLMEALDTVTVRVPIIGGAKMDLLTMKKALNSALEVMQALESSVYKLLKKAEHADALLSEVAKTAVKERAYLEECGDLLDMADSIQSVECSLRAHLVQGEQEKMRHEVRSIC